MGGLRVRRRGITYAAFAESVYQNGGGAREAASGDGLPAAQGDAVADAEVAVDLAGGIGLVEGIEVDASGFVVQEVAALLGGPVDADALDAAIRADIAAGHTPAGVIAITGGTGIGASDDLAAVLRVAHAHDLYTHLDAAWAGSAMI